MNKYERDAIRDVVTGILRDYINHPDATIDSHQLRLIIEKGHAKAVYPFPMSDQSRSDEFVEEIIRLMRQIGRADSGRDQGYRLTEGMAGRVQLTFFNRRSR